MPRSNMFTRKFLHSNENSRITWSIARQRKDVNMILSVEQPTIIVLTPLCLVTWHGKRDLN